MSMLARIYKTSLCRVKIVYLILCYNCCCRYISSLNTSILHFRSLNYINNIISMAMDRKTIVSLHKNVRVIRPLQKSFKFGVKRFWKWAKSSGRHARHPIDRATAEREQFEPSEWFELLNEKVEDKSPSFGDQTSRRGWNQPDFDAPHP